MTILYLVRTPAELVTLGRAVSVISGLSEPIRGTVVGGPDTLPREYEGPFTPGWTTAAQRGSWVSADLSVAAAPVPAGLEHLAGLTIDLDGQLFTLPSLDEAVTAEQLPHELTPEGGAWWWEGREDDEGRPIP